MEGSGSVRSFALAMPNAQKHGSMVHHSAPMYCRQWAKPKR
jgi:hypothetical protein